jgi:hypothetical protein
MRRIGVEIHEVDPATVKNVLYMAGAVFYL